MKMALILTVAAIAVAGPMRAQTARYESTTQITGGSLVDMMKQLSFMKPMKDVLAPVTSTTMVHGNRKATVTKDSTEIVDLDKETMTRVDNTSKTYTVTTFAEMRQRIAEIPAQMQQAQKEVQAQPAPASPPPDHIKVTADVSVKNTGESKAVNGEMAQEQVVTMATHLTDTEKPLVEGENPVTYTMVMDVWLAPEPAEMKAIDEFDLRMAKKLMQGVDTTAMVAQMRGMQKSSQVNMSGLFATQPGAGEAMKQMGVELEKLKGTPILTTMSMGGLVKAEVAAAAKASAPTGPPPTAGSVAGQVAADTAAQTVANQASKLGSFGSALGSSALGAFRRKKAAPAPAPAEAASAPVPVPPGTPPGMVNMTLIEMTEQRTNFATDVGAGAAFQVPAGYRQVK